MKAREMIEALGKLDPEIELYLSSDGEGNSYRPVDVAQLHHAYVDDGEIDLVHFDKEDMEENPESYEGVDEIVIIWPAW